MYIYLYIIIHHTNTPGVSHVSHEPKHICSKQLLMHVQMPCHPNPNLGKCSSTTSEWWKNHRCGAEQSQPMEIQLHPQFPCWLGWGLNGLQKKKTDWKQLHHFGLSVPLRTSINRLSGLLIESLLLINLRIIFTWRFPKMEVALNH